MSTLVGFSRLLTFDSRNSRRKSQEYKNKDQRHVSLPSIVPTPPVRKSFSLFLSPLRRQQPRPPQTSTSIKVVVVAVTSPPKPICSQEIPERFNGRTSGIWHGHLDHRTSWARSGGCRQRGGYGRTGSGPASAGSWCAHRRTYRSVLVNYSGYF